MKQTHRYRQNKEHKQKYKQTEKNITYDYKFLNSNRNELIFIFSIFIISIIIRLLYYNQIKTIPTFTTLAGDSLKYNEWAKDILSNGWIGQNVFYQSPFYPYFLALIYKIGGLNIVVVRYIQIIMNSITCVLFYVLGKKICGNKLGVIASLISVFYSQYIFFTPMLLKPTLYIFFESLLILLLFTGVFEKKPPAIFMSGLLFGIMTLVRENTLIVIMFFSIWFIYYLIKHSPKKTIAYICLFWAGIILAILPVTIRNYAVSGELVLITSQGGANFYIGNNPNASGTYAPLFERRGSPEYEGEDAKRLAENETGNKLSMSEVSRFWYKKAFDYIKNNKAGYLKLLWKKIKLYLNYYEIPDVEDYYFYKKYSSVLRAPLITFGIICPLAIFGIYLSFIHKLKSSQMLFVLSLSNMVSIIIFFVFARYRLPIVPLLIILSSYTIFCTIHLYNSRQLKKLVKNIVILIILFIFVYSKQFQGESGMLALSHFNIGESYRRSGMYEKAIMEFERAVEIDPYFSRGYNNLAGVYLVHKHDRGKAIYYWEKTLAINPQHYDASYNLAIIYSQAGYPDKARIVLKNSLKNHGYNPKIQNLLSSISVKD